MRLKKSTFLILIVHFLFSVLTIAAPYQLTDVDKSQLETYRQEAYDAQKTLQRDKLDTIADKMILLAGEDSEYKNLAFYFKSDGQSRTNPPLAITYGEEALEYFTNKEDHFLISRISNVLANALSNTGQHRKAIELYEKALSSAIKIKKNSSPSELRFRAGISYNAGFALVRQGDLDGAATYLYNARDIALQLKDTLIICSVINQIGNIHAYRGEYKKALTEYREGVRLASQGSLSSLPYLLSGLSGAYQEMGVLDSALYYNLQTSDIFRKNKNNTSLCNSLYNRAELYLAQNKLTESIATSEELMALSSQMGINQFVLNSSVILAKAHMALEEDDKALHYIQKALKEIDGEIEFAISSNIYKLAAQLHEKKGNYHEALNFEKLYKEYSDSLLNQQTLAHVDQLQIEYETAQKEQKIVQLETSQALDSLAFRQKLLLGIGLIVAIILIAAIVLLFFNRKRILAEKQRDSVEQRLLRSQMNPHFIFNAISSIQNYLFDKNDLKVALNYLSKFADLMRQILENSREEYITLSAEIRALKNYLELQQLRYNNSFGYELIIDPDIDPDKLLVPPLIAQPFVENAIEHGMIYRIENGKVKIKVVSQSDEITMTIEDNGVGSRQLKVNTEYKPEEKKSLATIMTRERLDHISKMTRRKFDLAIDALQSGGTIVTIQLPKVSAA